MKLNIKKSLMEIGNKLFNLQMEGTTIYQQSLPCKTSFISICVACNQHKTILTKATINILTSNAQVLQKY